MTSTSRDNPIGVLNPITDSQAAATISRETLEELVASAMEVSAPPARRSPSARTRSRRRRPVLMLALAAGAAAAILAAATALVGHGLTGAQPADAEILRGADAALHPAGSIVVESFTTATTCHGASCRLAREGDGRFSLIRETSKGDLGDELVLTEPGFRPRVEMAVVGSGAQLYDPIGNVIHVFSAYGHELAPGPTPGTYLYRLPSQQTLLQDEGVADQTPVPPDVSVGPLTLTITARQALELRDGAARIAILKTAGARYHLRVEPAYRTAEISPSEQARMYLGALRVAGRTVVDGRPAIKLVPIHGRGEYDVAPGTYYPIREIDVAHHLTTTWSEYRVLPATHRNQSLLSLTARHPSAHIDGSNAAYLAAWKRLTFGD